MKIALIATNYAEYAANLAIGLAASHTVLLVLSARSAKNELLPESLTLLRKRVALRIVPHHYAPLQPAIALIIARYISDFRPDIVHVQEHPTSSMHRLVKNLNGAFPFVTTVHDPVPHSGRDTKAANLFAGSYLGLRAASDRLIVHGDSLVRSLSKVLPDGPKRVRAAPFGALRFGDLSIGPLKRTAIEHALILFGRMNRYKGLDLLLDANELWARDDDVPNLFVAGTGSEIARLRGRLRAAPNVTLLAGRVSQTELGDLVGRCVAAILPYHDATQSGAAASAFGVGTPVIATSVGALPEMIRPGENGLLVPPGDPKALAHAARRLLSDDGLRRTLSDGALRTANETLSWANIGAITETIYEEARATWSSRSTRHQRAWERVP